MNAAVHATATSSSSLATLASISEAASTSREAPRSGYGLYEELAKQAGQPLVTTVDGKRLAAPVRPLDGDKASAMKKRFMGQLGMAAKSTNVTQFLHDAAVEALKPKDNESPSTRNHRVQTLILWGCFLLALNILKEDHWASDVILAYAPGFLRARVLAVPGRFSQFVKAITLNCWFHVFLHCILVHAHQRRTMISVGLSLLTTGNLYQTLKDTMDQLVVEFALSRKRRVVHYFGRDEAILMIEEGLQNLVSSGCLMKLQLIVAICISFITGCRPGSLCPTFEEYKVCQLYCKLENLRFRRLRDSSAEFEITLELENSKVPPPC
ncbi:hypothetical protein HETIRDRAFT_166664 [Heterobasidion irregulare TC 32-1]|uniref:Uncharacterized protein n=1 Tax=Heterobasidion irregulare (strain TC 32-1) TaxID=747525 RepID=W4KN44_HETIT|nr:uncharacterized protein HETIRDRAFT_166664 [Heterobasidion irregulare TC 32-1]ETW87134.1 hypothetical protein HETIRDRAFT_166664 [Heterobasidion irregulare TC 32-1]